MSKPRKRHPMNALSSAFVRTVAEAGRYCDGHGLYLDVQPSGSRSWVQRITIGGRRRELGLGGYPIVSLKDARAQAFANRQLARAGGDPLAEKRRSRNLPTFAAAAEQVWNQLKPGWRNEKYARDWIARPQARRLPPPRREVGGRGDEPRCHRRAPAHLALVADDGEAHTPAHQRGDGMGGGDGIPGGQPVPPHRAGARPPAGERSAHARRCPIARSRRRSKRLAGRRRGRSSSSRSSFWC